MKRTPLARTVGLRRGVALSTPPLQRRPALDIPEDVRALLAARSGGRCEPGVVGVCTTAATDAHHRRRRGVGLHPHAITNLVAACRPCHRHAHANPGQARAQGWIVSAYSAEPSIVPMMVRGRRCLLGADGSYLELTSEGVSA